MIARIKTYGNPKTKKADMDTLLRDVHLQSQADAPGLTDTLLVLSRVYDKMGRTEDARGLRERATRSRPADER